MNNMYKRQYRELSDETKQKLSDAAAGKQKSDIHKQHISQSMIEYWRGVPHKPKNDMREYLDNN